MVPKALQKLYDDALLFLDKETECNDHYWASRIVRAIRQLYPDCGGSHTATANIAKEKSVAMTISRKGSPSCQDPPLYRKHVCDSPGHCTVADMVRRIRREDESDSPVTPPRTSDRGEPVKQLPLFSASL